MAGETKRDRVCRFLQSGKWNTILVYDAILESGLPRGLKMALWAIVSHRSDISPKPSPGVRRLAHLASSKPHTVLAAVDELERLGLIRIERGHRASHRYDLGPLMKGLLTVVQSGTVTVPKEATVTDAPTGTVDDESPGADCADPGIPTVAHFVRDCADRDNPRDQEATNEATSERGAAPPLALLVQDSPSTKARRRKPASAKPRPKASHRAPEGFVPKDEQAAREIARTEHKDYERELVKFRDHEFKRALSDWDAAFRNWLRNDFGPRTGINGAGPRQKNRPGGYLPPVQTDTSGRTGWERVGGAKPR